MLLLRRLGAAIIEVESLESELDPGVDEPRGRAGLLGEIGDGHPIAQVLADDPGLLLGGPAAAGRVRFTRWLLLPCS